MSDNSSSPDDSRPLILQTHDSPTAQNINNQDRDDDQVSDISGSPDSYYVLGTEQRDIVDHGTGEDYANFFRRLQGKGTVGDTPDGSPAPSVPRFDPSTDLSADGMVFVEHVAKALSSRLVDDFGSASDVLRVYLPPMISDLMETRQTTIDRHDEREYNLDKLLETRLGGIRLQKFGITKVMVAKIPQGNRTRWYDPRPPPPPLTAEELLVERPMRPDTRIVIPGRLIMNDYKTACWVPSSKVLTTLEEIVEEQAIAGLKAKGAGAYETLLRAKRLFAAKEGMDPADLDAVCLWRLMEEDIEWVRNVGPSGKVSVTRMDWKCRKCGKWHALQVDEE